MRNPFETRTRPSEEQVNRRMARALTGVGVGVVVMLGGVFHYYIQDGQLEDEARNSNPRTISREDETVFREGIIYYDRSGEDGGSYVQINAAKLLEIDNPARRTHIVDDLAAGEIARRDEIEKDHETAKDQPATLGSTILPISQDIFNGLPATAGIGITALSALSMLWPLRGKQSSE